MVEWIFIFWDLAVSPFQTTDWGTDLTIKKQMIEKTATTTTTTTRRRTPTTRTRTRFNNKNKIQPEGSTTHNP